MEIQANSILTWQRSSDASADLCPDPVPIQTVIPNWFKSLKGNFGHYSNNSDYVHTARHCLGLRGAMNLGWTIPWQSGFIRGVPLHAEQLHGSIWAEKLDQDYKWHMHIMCWPWRARLPRGWRLLMAAHPLVWSQDWFAFAGCVDSNYHVIDQHNVGLFWNYDYTIDQDYCYFNIENVMAFRQRDGYDAIPPGTPIFSAIPVYDPDYEPVVKR
jgi:hypothetical protein